MHGVTNSLLRDCRNNTPFAVCRNYRIEKLNGNGEKYNAK